MEVELTARQVRISKALRAQAEDGMDRIARILGKTTSAAITFRVQRHLQIAEVTIKARLHRISGLLQFIDTNPSPSRSDVLERLKNGEITAAEAISELEAIQ